jgi:hypothetical protein
MGAGAHQPTFTFSSKQRSAGIRQVSWLSGLRGVRAFPVSGWPSSERRSPITVAGPRGIFTRFPILSAEAEHLMRTTAQRTPL